MDTYYLIDFENVNSDGLKGCDKLKETDHIIIFFTKNAMKINMSDIAEHGEATLKMIEVPAGKQSEDIHISSYLGYLVGVNNGKDINAVIVSKDTDFDGIAKFWQTRSAVKVTRANAIKQPAPKAGSEKQPEQKAESPVKNNKKTDINNVIMQTLSKEGYKSEIPGAVASLVVKLIDEKNAKQTIYRKIISTYGQSEGLNIYNHIKKTI